jgi:hypothetical protein
MDSVDDQIAEDAMLLAENVPAAVMVAADRAKAEAQKINADRRAHRRVPAKALDWIEVARVKYGPDVNIVDLSTTGVLLESARPMAPGSKQALEIAAGKRSIVVPFGVLRSKISALAARGAVYRVACSFSRPLELPELAAAAEALSDTERAATTTQACGIPEPVEAEPLMATVLREAVKDPVPKPRQAAGYQKVVLRFLDGTMLKGYNADFDVNRPALTVLPEPDADTAGVSVPLVNLKALFYVREFTGNAEYRERKTFLSQGPGQGRRIQVTFSDGETLSGTTQGYRAGGTGFFVTPADPRANNFRIFAFAGAVRQVRFP